MGKTVTVNTGFTNVALGQSFYDDGDVVDISDDEYDNLVDNYGSVEALEIILTIGGNVADPVYTPVISSRLASLESRVGVAEGDIDDLEVDVADHEDRIVVLETP